MDDLRVGRALRSVRLRSGSRQIDIGHRAGVSQQSVAVAEAGRLDSLSVRTLRAIARALGIDLALAVRWKGGEIDRLLDREHAALVEAAVKVLRGHGWQLQVELTFNHFGERGSVDIVAWQTSSRAVLIIEVKTRVYDVEELLRKLDAKARIVPGLMGDRMTRPLHVGKVLVLNRSTANRRLILRHAATFTSTLPAGSAGIRTWLRQPAGNIACVWMVSFTSGAGGRPSVVGRQRMRRPLPRSARAASGASSAGREAQSSPITSQSGE